MAVLNKLLTNVVLTEASMAKMQRILATLFRDVDATAVVLVEKSGQLLALEGDTKGIDTVAVASLVSGSFSSSRAVAKLIGENDFVSMFQQGERTSIYMSALGTRDVLVVVFVDPAKTGLVKVHIEQAAKLLTSELQALMGSAPDPLP
jgi:predicted regulator of Ras-like GTPase activity (Roadblock/LC7/MglB family)